MRWLKPAGALVVKMFQGEGIDAWIKDMRAMLRQGDARQTRSVARPNRERFMGLRRDSRVPRRAQNARGGRP